MRAAAAGELGLVLLLFVAAIVHLLPIFHRSKLQDKIQLDSGQFRSRVKRGSSTVTVYRIYPVTKTQTSKIERRRLPSVERSLDELRPLMQCNVLPM